MVALATVFVSSFVLALSGAMMPGPLLTATIGESARRGFWAGPTLILGHSALELALVMALLTGLAPLFSSQAFFIGVALAGSAILLWMAASMFWSLPRLQLSLEAEGPKRSSLVASGALLSVSNPYWTVWWATIGLGYLLQRGELGWPGAAAFFLGHIAADFAWYAAVSAAVARGRRFLSDGLYRGVIGVCAMVLLVFAGVFAYAGLDRLLAV